MFCTWNSIMQYKYLINAKCEFFPCHDLHDWRSCLFCYCPLFLLPCPGPFTQLSSGHKDCSQCVMPHTEQGYDIIQEELQKNVFSITGVVPRP